MNLSGAEQLVEISRVILAGTASAVPLVLEEPLSFWGGLDPETGCVIDVHHPQRGACIKNRLLFLPGARGSTAGPGALLEALYAGNGPAAIVLTRPDVSALIAVAAASYVGIASVPIVEVVPNLPQSLHCSKSTWKVDCLSKQIVAQVSQRRISA